jgi:hypothetical protein
MAHQALCGLCVWHLCNRIHIIRRPYERTTPTKINTPPVRPTGANMTQGTGMVCSERCPHTPHSPEPLTWLIQVITCAIWNHSSYCQTYVLEYYSAVLGAASHAWENTWHCVHPWISCTEHAWLRARGVNIAAMCGKFRADWRASVLHKISCCFYCMLHILIVANKRSEFFQQK